MNELIEELYKQSFIEVQDENSFPCMTFSKQKFAELIVLESIEYCGENLSKTVGGALKIHFGVKQ
jgi:hypothetical protein